MNQRASRSRASDRFMTGVFYCVGGFFVLLLVVLVGYIVVKGFADMDPSFLAFDRTGIGNQLFNTIYLVFLSLLICVPLGVAAGIYMAEYAKPGKLTKFIRICIETLSSLPSIVVGLFGYLVFLLMTGATWNLLAGAGATQRSTVPLITTTTEDAFRALPASYREGGLALGTTHWQTILHVLLPACVGRIITGVILAAGRGFGEAAALLYTAGQSTNINWTNWNITSPTCPLNPLRPGETLALHIWTMRTEGSLYANSTEIANFSAAVLVLLVFAFSLLARYISRRMARKASGQ